MKEEITLVIPLGIGKEIEYLQEIEKQNLKAIKEFGINPSENRNRGANKVKTKYIGFINGHTKIDDTWKDKTVKFFKEHPEIDIVGGPQLTSKDEKGFAKISGYALSSKFGAAGLSLRYNPGKINLNADEKSITSANLICKREIFKKIEFNESIYPGEDPKFIEDAKKAGLRVAYSPEIIVYNKRRETIHGFAKQIFNYGKVRPEKEKFIDTLKKPFFIVPSLFFIYLLLLIMAGMLGGFSLFGAFPLILYVILAVLFSFYDSIKNNNFMAFFILPFIYLIIHLSYGAGMIWGYIRK